jgi:hypothetical protein
MQSVARMFARAVISRPIAVSPFFNQYASFAKKAAKQAPKKQAPKRFRRKVDPYKKYRPKRPLTAYMLFIQSARAALVAQFPKKKITEINKLLGQQWNKLDAAGKRPYEIKFNRAKAAYQKKADAFVVPKRPGTGYSFLVSELIKKNPGKSFAVIGKNAAAAWKKLSAADKNAFYAKAAKANAKYKKDLAAFNKKYPPQA